MEQERENIVENKLGMSWFKFIIYVQLFYNVIAMGIMGLFYVTGRHYAENAALVYAYYGVALKIMDVSYGVLNLALAIFAFYTRMRLAGYKKNGPLCYMIFWGIQGVVSVAYLFGTCVFTGQWQVFVKPSVLGSFLGTAIGFIVNYIYFKKRKALFVN